MSYPLTEQEFNTIAALSPDERYDYFVAKAVEGGELWGLSSAEGWVALSAGDAECLPFWPHPDFAAAWATGDWADCTPTRVELSVWLERWAPGMERDGALAVVFPNDSEESVVVAPAELAKSLRAELAAASGR